MNRCLEFTLATFVITVVSVTFALWVGSLVANKITELFNQVAQALQVL